MFACAPAVLLNVPSHLGPLALMALIAGESMGLPLPGETALIAAALLARAGQLRIEEVVGLAALAAIVGDNMGFALGRHGGRRLLERRGPLARHRRALLERGEPFFARHGPKAVLLGRWVAGLRIATAWLAGINRMQWPSFLFWNALGGIAWATSVGLAAFFAGPVVERLIKMIGLGTAVAAALLLASLLGWRYARRRRKRTGNRPSASGKRTGPTAPAAGPHL